MNPCYVISGCSGGGKSTLLAELKRRGYSVMEEPGRRVVTAELKNGGAALPWIDMRAFLSRAIDLALNDLRSAKAASSPVFFDRGLVDALSALAATTGEMPDETLMQEAHQYHRQVFMLPPWPEIYAQDNERRHDLSQALSEYERLLKAYPAYGYDIQLVPMLTVSQRADFVLSQLKTLIN
ncbi:AAA family ATPase [Herbaspirillum sp. NPDC087042]|uniref:AAA family ATPase n=1 Tax=Herbaspirillum sp. NPDC087042 TaxID=3364004 RepID=UPI003824CD95